MLLTTQDNFSNYEIVETLGIVRGNTVRARHVGKDILASFRNIVGERSKNIPNYWQNPGSSLSTG